jgi:hypothetical protein
MVCYRNERRTEDNICVQICILYYILLYEDVRLANMRNILASGRQVSPKLLVVRCSVPDPRSGAFLPPGSGMNFFRIWNPDSG